MTSPATNARPTLKTTETTNEAVRRLAARVSAALDGRRVTHDRLIFALTELVPDDDAVQELARKIAGPETEGSNAIE